MIQNNIKNNDVSYQQLPIATGKKTEEQTSTPQHLLARTDRRNRRIWLGLGVLALLAGLAAFPFMWRTWVTWRYADHMVLIDDAPAKRVAIVFGARIYPDGSLSAMLGDRVDAAVDLYHAGKVEKIIMSGDNQSDNYNEPGAMMAYAQSRGVPALDMQPDYGGRRTYDTCYRARYIFQVESAILVTQAFHLPRALFICHALGTDVIGVIADRRTYHPRSIAWSESREIPALLAALLDVTRRAPPPVLGEPLPIY